MGAAHSSKLVSKDYQDAVNSLTPEEISVLRKQFADLAARSPNPELIDKRTFLRFLPLPGMLGERLFSVADRAQNGGLDLEEFICCMAILVRGTEEERYRLLYDMYNFSSDTSGIVFQELVTMISSVVFADSGSSSSTDASFGEVSRTASGGISRTISGGISPPLSPHLPPAPNPPYLDLLGTSPSSFTPIYDYEGLPPSEAIARIAEEIKEIDDQLEQCTELAELTQLYNAKHALEQRLSKYGQAALEAYRRQGKTLHHHLSKLAQEALEQCDTDRSGKLSYEQFKDWATRNPVVFDSVFNNHTVYTLADRLSRLPGAVSSKAFNRPMSPVGEEEERQDQIHGHLLRPGRILKAWIRKYFALQDGFLYEFKSQKVAHSDHPEPADAVFLEGASITVPDSSASYVISRQIDDLKEQIQASQAQAEEHGRLEQLMVQLSEQEAQLAERGAETERFEFHVVLAHRKIVLAAESERQRTDWIKALEKAAHVRRVEDFYRINYGSPLGKGCFADVYTCEEIATGQRFAVKIVDKSSLTESEAETLSAEISCLNLVRHPNVVSKKDIFETAAKVFMVTELLLGGTIVDRINKSGRFTPDRARSIMRNILEGLSYLHDSGIVHRDLKPSNIAFVTEAEDSVVKILDFGFSVFSRPQDAFTRPVGTLKYFAPEMIKGLAYNSAVDMWCLGVVLYIMLVGRFPFAGETEINLLENIEKVRFDRTHPSYKSMPEAPKNLLKRLLRLEPTQRLTARQALAHPWFQDQDQDHDHLQDLLL